MRKLTTQATLKSLKYFSIALYFAKPHTPLSRYWINPEMSLNSLFHLRHLDSFSSYAGKVRCQVSCKKVQAPEGFVAYVALINATVEGRREGKHEAMDCNCIESLSLRNFD